MCSVFWQQAGKKQKLAAFAIVEELAKVAKKLHKPECCFEADDGKVKPFANRRDKPVVFAEDNDEAQRLLDSWLSRQASGGTKRGAKRVRESQDAKPAEHESRPIQEDVVKEEEGDAEGGLGEGMAVLDAMHDAGLKPNRFLRKFFLQNRIPIDTPSLTVQQFQKRFTGLLYKHNKAGDKAKVEAIKNARTLLAKLKVQWLDNKDLKLQAKVHDKGTKLRDNIVKQVEELFDLAEEAAQVRDRDLNEADAMELDSDQE